MASHSAQERQALVEAMIEAGADAPTLCEGWTVRDLAAHLVTRERRLDTLPGIVLPGLARWTEHVRRGQARRPFDDLVADVRNGPPWTSPFALPGVDAATNLGEHFVHCEDVRRAQGGWTPRELPAARRSALQKLLTTHGRALFARSPVGVVLATPDGRRHVAKGGSPAVTLTGEPGELALYAYGRTTHALVELTGDPDAVERFRSMRLAV